MIKTKNRILFCCLLDAFDSKRRWNDLLRPQRRIFKPCRDKDKDYLDNLVEREMFDNSINSQQKERNRNGENKLWFCFN